MTLLTLRRRLFERVGEDPDDPKFYTAAEATSALNAAQTVLCLLTLTARKAASVTIAGADPLADCLSLLPDLIVPLAIRVSGVRLKALSLARLIALNRSWLAATGAPTHYTLIGANLLGLYPHQAGQALTVDYAYVPAEMTLNASVPDVREALHDALVDYAAWRLRLKPGDGPLQESEADLGKFFQAVQAEASLVRAEFQTNQYDALPPEVTLAQVTGALRGR